MTTTENAVRNGVDAATLFATLDAVKGDTELAKFQFRATNDWVSGTHNRSTIHGFHGAGQEDTSRPEPFTYDADHPPVLVGIGPRPDAGGVPAARHRRVPHRGPREHRRGPRHHPHRVSSTVEGDIDLLGILGLSDEVRNGYRQINVHFDVEGDDPREAGALVEQSRRRSAVYDVLTNGTDVQIDVSAR